MKTLVIYPDSTVSNDSVFYLLDPETGSCLASHFCSGAYHAKSDLHDFRPERLEQFEKDFGEKTQALFIDETNYNWDEIYEKNQKLREDEEKE